MIFLYLSTDEFEAEGLVDPDDNLGFICSDMPIGHGEILKKSLGFNPMCSIDLGNAVNAKRARSMAVDLVKQGLFVAMDDDGKIETFMPKDLPLRNALVELALRKRPDHVWKDDQPAYFLLKYSNNPYAINPEKPISFTF